MFCRCLSTLPKSRLMMTASQAWSSATGQYSPPGLTLPPCNDTHQSHPPSKARLHSSMQNHPTASPKRANQKRLNPTRANLKKAKLTEKKAAVRQWPDYLSQRRRTRRRLGRAGGAAADQTAAAVEFRENPVNPVGPNTEERAPVKVPLHFL